MIESLLVWGIILVLYVLRNQHPVFTVIWKGLRLFFLVLLATLALNYAKDKFKEWWKQ